MSDWAFVTLEATIAAHHRQIEAFGGADGLRDEGRLEAAVARVPMLASYEPDADAARLAAAYAHGISKGHPFVDGNKRAGWVVARLFLLKNGLTLNASQAERYEKMLGLAAGEISEDAFADWLRAVIVPTSTT